MVDAAEALDALARAADLLARADLSGLTDRDLLEHTVAVDRQVTRLESARARALGAIDRRRAYTEDGCGTTGSWLRWRTRRDFAPGDRDGGGRAPARGPAATRAALDAGEILLSHPSDSSPDVAGGAQLAGEPCRLHSRAKLHHRGSHELVPTTTPGRSRG